jgi:hypothetical protein
MIRLRCITTTRFIIDLAAARMRKGSHSWLATKPLQLRAPQELGDGKVLPAENEELAGSGQVDRLE